MRDEATTQGASVPDTPVVENVERTPTPRETAVLDLADKFEQQRNIEREEVHAADPEQKKMHDDLVAEQKLADEGATVEAMADVPVPDSDETKTAGAQENLQTDPLTEYIVTNDDGVQCFATVIDGQQKLVPLDAARQQLQKRESGEVRLQQAAERGRFLDERELQIQASERALQDRFEKIDTKALPPDTTDVGDREALRKGAQDVVTSLFSETEEAAADKLVDFIVENRTPQATAPAPIDTGKIADDAANAAVEKLDERVVARDANAGYEQFQTDYPDIMADSNLFRVADAKTDEISAAHPDWPQSRVMAQAGKETREWAVGVKPGDASPAGDPPNTDRQDRKGELVRMPTAAAGATASIEIDDSERGQTPKEALTAIREARGQAQ